jgi:Ca2+-binding RTX toxin-like protein
MASYTYGGSTSGYVSPIGITGYNNIFGLENTNDTLIGGNQNDYIDGKSGADLLVGNDGLDILQGSGGSDTFVFQINRGYDTVKDFQASSDKIRISSYGGATGYTFSDLTFVQQNGGTSILLKNTETVWMHLDGFIGTLNTAHFN